jgi:ketosteroid isomerase-like protein
MDRKQLNDWLDGYIRLWKTPGTDELGSLFREDAVYLIGPFEEPAEGLQAIAELWERERRAPDEEFEFDREIVAVDGDTGVARLEVRYGPPIDQIYRDLWVIRLDEDGRCFRFEEWPHWPEQSTVAPGKEAQQRS